MNNPNTKTFLDVQFLASYPDLESCPDTNGLPEIAFAGRSNAGKSSVLNRLAGNRGMAKVSKTPGRTQLLNFFSVANRGVFVDLPGYGYAKASRKAQAKWQRNVNAFLSYRSSLTAVVLVTDIRHPGQPFDIEFIEWATASGIPLLVLLNKADKLSNNKQNQSLAKLQHFLAGNDIAFAEIFSALKGTGLDNAANIIDKWLLPE